MLAPAFQSPSGAIVRISLVSLRCGMVINSHYRFIFIHVPKTAGTSVTRSLQGIEGDNKRWLARTKHETLAEFHDNIEQRLSPADRASGLHPRGFSTFAFVRNPWDRMSSFYRYLVEKRPKAEISGVASFRDFLDRAESGEAWIQALHSMRSQLDYFTFPDGAMALDFLGHFEHLAEDLGSVSRLTGVPLAIGQENSSSNCGGDYRRDYDAAMVEKVADRFQEEIALFGYAFDDPYPSRRCSARLDDDRNRLIMPQESSAL